MPTRSIEIRAVTPLSMAHAESRLREALAAEGFGILTEIDAAAVLKAKLDVDVEPYRIFGACNPQIAYEAMQIWRGFGLIAPCHIALYDVGDRRVAMAMDPTALPAVRDNPRLLPLMERARDAVERAIRTLAGD